MPLHPTNTQVYALPSSPDSFFFPFLTQSTPLHPDTYSPRTCCGSPCRGNSLSTCSSFRRARCTKIQSSHQFELYFFIFFFLIVDFFSFKVFLNKLNKEKISKNWIPANLKRYTSFFF